jgi:hypothetical protein
MQRPGPLARAAAVVAAGAGAVVAVTELVHLWLVGHDDDSVGDDGAGGIGGRPLPAGTPGVIVVLGLPGTNPALRAAQRWRVDQALQLWRSGGWERVVFTGGAVRSAESEAAQMAALAVRSGLDEAAVVLDERSRSTWENVVEASRLVGDADVVAIMSDGLHAARARTYWRDQQGPAAPRLVLGHRHRPFRHLWIRVPSTAVEVLHRIKRRAGGPSALSRWRSRPTPDV